MALKVTSLSLLMCLSCGARSELTAPNDVGGAPPAPLQDGDLILWLDARAGVELDADGHLSAWRDQSGYHHDAHQAAASARPSVDAILDGASAPRFDGVDDHLTLDPGFEDFTRGLSAFMVVRPRKTPYLHASRFFDFSRANGALNDAILWSRFGAGDELLYQTYQGAKIGIYVDAPKAIVDETWQLFEVVAQGGEPGSPAHAAMYSDGELVTEGDVAVPTLVLRSSNFIARSNLNGPIDSLLAGDIAELRIYRAAASDIERQQIESEMKQRWGFETE